MWQKLGLATYLLCMLVKQHTGTSTATMLQSILSLQLLITEESLCTVFI
jgi:hypothetical protein